jgi:hypothetical protein
MGLFDKMKKIADAATQRPQQPQEQQHAHAQHQHAAEPHVEEVEPDDNVDEQFDVAGFDPDDEDSFYNAVLHMESEGQFGGTDASRAEIMARFGIRDRSHWHVVKDSVYALLARRFGSYEEVGQREMNWRQGQMQRHMQAQTAKVAAGGGMTAVEGVSLDAWAAINASIASGANPDDLLKGAGLDKAKWDRVSAEWNKRMSTDTTFAIATAYGNAFQAVSKGKFGAHAREAAAARAQNRDLQIELPMPYEQYYEILMEQRYAAEQNKDPVEALRTCGLSVIDWTDLGAFMGYFFNRTAVREWKKYEDIHKRVEAKLAAKYPGVQIHA